jgi:hypothetical protein
MRRKTNNQKTCPLLDEKCLGPRCAIFNEPFERCEIGLLAYNLYQLATAIKQQLDKDRTIIN